jgi:predicted porin
VIASLNVGTARSSVDIRGLPFDPLTGALCPEDAPCSASDESRNFVGNLSVSKSGEETTLTFDVSRGLAPQSDGTQDITDTFSLYVQRTLTKRLSTSAGALFSNSSAVGDLGRQNQKYSNLNFSLSWQLTATLSTYGKYSYFSIEENGQSNPDTGNVLYFGVSYQGVGFRR